MTRRGRLLGWVRILPDLSTWRAESPPPPPSRAMRERRHAARDIQGYKGPAAAAIAPAVSGRPSGDSYWQIDSFLGLISTFFSFFFFLVRKGFEETRLEKKKKMSPHHFFFPASNFGPLLCFTTVCGYFLPANLTRLPRLLHQHVW